MSESQFEEWLAKAEEDFLADAVHLPVPIEDIDAYAREAAGVAR